MAVREKLVELKSCPVCGAKAYISSAAPDGYFMGWSVGCPRYCIGDSIHGIDTFEEDEKMAFALHGFFTVKEAIEAWNRRADNGFYGKGVKQKATD